MRSFVGKVVSNKMQKSVVVLVDRFAQHPKYPKIVRTTKKFMAHDETNNCNIGDEAGHRLIRGLVNMIGNDRKVSPLEGLIRKHIFCLPLQKVRIHSSRPISKRKAWTVGDILRRANIYRPPSETVSVPNSGMAGRTS